MHIENTLTKKEYRRIMLSIYRLPLYLVLTLICLIAWMALSGASGNLQYVERFFEILFAIYLFLSLIFVIAILNVNSAKYKIGKNLFNKQEMDFEEDGVTINSDVSHETKKWNAFIKWREIAGHYLLFTAPTVFLAIKEENIPSSQLNEFKSLLTSKLGKAAKR